MHKLFYKNQWIKHGNNNSATYNLKIGPRGSFSTYDLFPRPFQKMCNAYWHISNFPLLKITYQLLKKISDEVSKVKKVKLLFYLALSMPVVTAGLFFYSSQPHMGPIWFLKLSILAFYKKLKSLKLIFKNPWVKIKKSNFCCIQFKDWSKRMILHTWLIFQAVRKNV